MFGSIQSAQTGKPTAKHQVQKSTNSIHIGDLSYDFRKYDGNRPVKKRDVRLCKLDLQHEAIVVDLEFLNGERNNEMVVKEMALYNHRCFQTYVFQPPYAIIGREWSKYRRSNRWVREKLNGFSWYDGQAYYTEMKKILKRTAFQFPVILTKGLQKKNFIANIIEDECRVEVINIEDFQCPNYKHINSAVSSRCLFHCAPKLRKFQCAVEKAVKYYNWLKEAQQQQKNE